MADITIRINTDNAAFGDTLGSTNLEVTRILDGLVDRLRSEPWTLQADTVILRDSNGNAVGTFDIEP